jgi:DNA N-6-adenine-methyltransferase (Dam)
MSKWETSLGASDDWFTPAYIFQGLGCMFDLDVAAPPNGPLHVPTFDWISNNSLNQQWSGFVWMNPPFGGRNGLAPWLSKFFTHGNGIALTPDRTSAPWFRHAWTHTDLLMFLPKVKFIRPDGSLGKQPGTGTALWAIGETGCTALKRATGLGMGILARPERI